VGLLVVALAGLAFVSWRPIEAGRAYLHRAGSSPLLDAFNAPSDLYFHAHARRVDGTRGLPVAGRARPGERALRCATRRSAAAVKVEEPFPTGAATRARARPDNPQTATCE